MVQGHHLANETRRGGLPAPPQDRRLALSDFGGVRARFACRLFSDALHRSHFIPHADDCRTSRAFYGIYYYLSFAGYGGVVILVLGLIAEGLLILASYMGYKGLKGARLG